MQGSGAQNPPKNYCKGYTPTAAPLQAFIGGFGWPLIAHHV
jgi:hypothetical protein